MRRLGARRTIVTANPENVEHVLKTNFPNYPKGRPFTEILGDLLGCGIFSADGELWHTQRKLASHEFSTRSLCDFVVNALEFETGERLLPILSSACAHRGVVDMQELLRRFAFDTICKVSLGTDPGFLDASLPESPLADAFDVASAISAKRGAAPVFAVWKAKRALGLGSEGQLRAAVKLIHASVMEIIRTRKTEIKKGTQHNDLLSRLIVGGHKDEVIRDMVISFVMAGKDTTSAALTWFFWLLSCHPEAETEVAKEAKQAKGRLDYHALKDMKVLEACLCECMRLYPPVLWDSKHAAYNDTLPDGTRIKKGDRVTYFPYGMGRSEKLWGKNCMEFDYRRWLSESGELVRQSPFKFPVFQAGPRVCLGKEMAFVQMKYVAASVLREFELRREESAKQRPALVPLLTAHMAGGLHMNRARRLASSVLALHSSPEPALPDDAIEPEQAPEVDWAQTEADLTESEAPVRDLNVAQASKLRGREARRWFAHQLMLPEWMIDIPPHLDRDWYVFARPAGNRCFVVSSNGTTISRLRNGSVLHHFPSSLPNGSRTRDMSGPASSYCILDCIFHEPNQTYYVIDMVCWRGYSLYDCTAEFRFFWLNSKLAESGACNPPSTYHRYTFSVVPIYDCDQAGLHAAYSSVVPYVKDGLLFHNKHAHYQTGNTPLALVWKDNYCSEYFLDTDSKGLVPTQQQVVLEIQDDGRLTTSDDPPVVFGCVEADFIQKSGLRAGNLLRFAIRDESVSLVDGKLEIGGLQFVSKANRARAFADSYSKVFFQYAARHSPLRIEDLAASVQPSHVHDNTIKDVDMDG
ncbi:unnamed protein product [Musa acuminata subsp. burmannicoides]